MSITFDEMNLKNLLLKGIYAYGFENLVKYNRKLFYH